MKRMVRLDTVDDVLGWFAARGVGGLASDSRRVGSRDAFIAWPGYAVDGRRFVPQALAQGAAACLVEADGSGAFDALDVEAVGAFAGLKAATGEIAGRWYGEPSRKVDLIAVTGTNGKTSTAWWVAQGLSPFGQRCGVIGTLGIGEPPSAPARGGQPRATRAREELVNGRGRAESLEGPAGKASPAPAFPIEATGLTTPDPITLQRALKRFADAGFAACAVEATSIGLAEHRLAGARIGIALFTNLTQDHLDYHGSMDAYWQAKAQLFAWPGLRAAVVNVDDPRGAELAGSLASSRAIDSPQGGALDLWTCSTRQPARLRASNVRYGDAGGLAFDVEEAAGAEPPTRAQVRTAIVGDFHVGNLLVTLGALRASGVPLADAVAACAHLTPVPGRLQRIEAPQGVAGPVVVVDYAHTPDALEKALAAVRPLARERGGALWCVFGCGGDRDPAKRPLMGAVAARRADRTVLTSDNPRGEPPEAIVAQIAAGWAGEAGALERIVDRREAIAQAVARAAANDVVLLAGKGHEEYQDVAGVRHPLSDAVEAAAALERRGDGRPSAARGASRAAP